jgi:threonine dehydratase
MPGTVNISRMRTVEAPTREDVLAAERRIAGRLAPTPLVESDGFLLKLESLQPTGSFKVRGALAALTALEPGEPIVTASAGNHGLAVAWAAEQLGLDVTIVVAETASPAKIEGIRRFPAARLVLHGADYDEAEPVDTVVVPVGGGGLASGVALAAGARVVGVVPERFPAMRAALDAGRLVGIEGGETIADGLHGNIEPGSVTFELVRDRVADVVTVTEDDLLDAMRFLARRHGLVTEGAGAAATAAIRAGLVDTRGATVAVVSGRNVAPGRFAEVLGGGSGR